MINIEDEYIGLLSGILYGGKEKQDRTGTGTRAVFGRMLRHDMSLGFPILTTKKIYFEKAVTELLWILSGRTDIKYLNDKGVRYWDSDYARSGRTDGTLGPIYGHQWRNFSGVDQLRSLLSEIKKTPYSRRLMVSAWNPTDIPDMVLPPCHYSFQIYINDTRMSLMWQQRSADVFLGLPYDIVMYGLLLELLCYETKYKPGQLIASLGDCHLYNNHINQAKIQIKRSKFELPKLKLAFGLTIDNLHIPSKSDISLKNYKHHDAIKADLSVG